MIRSGDSVITFNFRPDRMRQLVRALGEEDFDEFDRGERAARPSDDDDPLPGGLGLSGRVRAEQARDDDRRAAGRRAASASCTSPRPRSTRTSRTSSTAARRRRTPGEERCLVPSPRDVPTYDHKPEMSAREAAARVRHALARGGRGGAAVPVRHHQLRERRHGRSHRRHRGRDARGRDRRLLPRRGRRGGASRRAGALIVTADHGNADQMLEPDGSPNTAHSTNPVPLIVTVEGLELAEGGILADVVPTALELLGIPKDPRHDGQLAGEERLPPLGQRGELPALWALERPATARRRSGCAGRRPAR